MNHPVDLGIVLANTFSDLSWTGFTVVCALGAIALMWCFLPLAVFGVRGRLEAMAERQHDQSLQLVTEFRQTAQILGQVWSMPVPKGEFDESYPPRDRDATHPHGR